MSTPLFQDFDPEIIPWQIEALTEIDRFDYSTGVLEVLFSGSIGSAKSILAAHLIATHAINNNKARVLIVRRALKDLKRTLWSTLLQHLSDIPFIIQSYNKTEMKITLINGSEIIGDSYDDMNLEKFRSVELSMAVIEEATESEKELYDAIKMRIGRLPLVKRNIYLLLTNPDSPSHYIYNEFINSTSPTKKVFYSLTEQNPFLPKWYIDNLKRDLDPKMSKRMLYGEWVEISKEVIYYAYNKQVNFRDIDYIINQREPIALTFDFNIGEGKPYSMLIGQYVGGEFHVLDEVVMFSSRTLDALEEIASRGYFELDHIFEIYGDATGNASSTKSIHSDYDIIEKFLSNYKRKSGKPIKFINCVPRSNPPIKERHNTVNSLCENTLGKNRLYLYKNCKTLDEGMRLTALKKGGNFIEDDSKHYQHCTTALGYWCVSKLNSITDIQIFTSQR
jgi:hypothetical protein